MKLITCSFAGERPAGAPEGGGDPRLHWHARSHRRLSATAVALLPRAQDACTAPPGSTGGRGRRWELVRRARVRVGGAARAGVATVLRRTCSPAMWRRMRGTCTQATHRALLSCRVVWMCSPGYGYAEGCVARTKKSRTLQVEAAHFWKQFTTGHVHAFLQNHEERISDYRSYCLNVVFSIPPNVAYWGFQLNQIPEYRPAQDASNRS